MSQKIFCSLASFIRFLEKFKWKNFFSKSPEKPQRNSFSFLMDNPTETILYIIL